MSGTPPPIRYHEFAPRPPEEGPVDLEASVPGEGPLELDVGFGRGASVFARAEAAPESRILGVEIKAKWAHKVDERRQRLGLDRVRIWSWDVRELLQRATPDACITRAFVHFPDPWWKKRHEGRIVVADVFLNEMARLMIPGGELFVQTDVEHRAEEYRARIAAHPEFVLAVQDGWLDHNPYDNASNRERRAIEDGLPIYRVLAHRRGLAATPATDPKCGGKG